MYQRSEEHLKNVAEARVKAKESQVKNKKLRHDQYLMNPVLCVTCKTIIPYEKRLVYKFCSRSCSAAYNNLGRKHSKETKHKISTNVSKTLSDNKVQSNSLLVKYPIFWCKQLKLCTNCKEWFLPKNKTRSFCSNSCSAKFSMGKPERRLFYSELQKRKVKEGVHSGWKSRKNKEPSYPEKYFMFRLDELKLEYEREYKEGKYFIDFAFHDLKLALEIDGKQHLLPERQIKDAEKNRYLASKGWTVFRIQWYNPTTGTNKLLLETQFKEFLKLLV